MKSNRIVASFLGVVLLSASLFKYQDITQLTVKPELITVDLWMQIGAVVLDIILGFWLLSGLFPYTIRFLSVTCFSVFALVSCYKTWHGEVSCGCFGSVKISPTITGLFDIFAIVALIVIRPLTRQTETSRILGVFGLGGIVVFALGVGLNIYEEITSISRGLIVANTYHRFEDAQQAERLTYSFKIENRCRFAVEIAESKATCLCTTYPDLTGCVIQPGETYELPITLDTGLADEHIIGGVNLFCRKAGTLVVPAFFTKLQVSAVVKPDYWVKDRIVDFGVVQGTELITKEVRIRPRDLLSLQIQRVNSSHHAFRGGTVKFDKETGDHLVEIVFDSRGLVRSGLIQTPLSIRTSSVRRPEISVLACVSYRAAFEIEPETLVIGSDITGKVDREVDLHGAAAFTVSDIRHSSNIEVEVKSTASDRKSWRLKVRIIQSSSNLNEQIRFRVNGGGVSHEYSISIYRFSR